MVTDLEAFGQDADGRCAVALDAFHLQEEHVLLRLQSNPSRGLFANPEEAPDLVVQLGEQLVVHRRGRTTTGAGAGSHRANTISRRDIGAMPRPPLARAARTGASPTPTPGSVGSSRGRERDG